MINERQLPMTLDQTSFLEGIAYLVKTDTDLAKIIHDLGPPPLWPRDPGFATLIYVILEQQVSLASAAAAFSKLQVVAGQLKPKRFLELTDEELKTIGFSRQKTRYVRELAQAIVNREIDLDGLHRLDDAAARHVLMSLKGIGSWTADIYLLRALLRPDIWPAKDLALAKAVRVVKDLPSKPSLEMLQEIARPWKPWRAVAARILWHYYLHNGSTG